MSILFPKITTPNYDITAVSFITSYDVSAQTTEPTGMMWNNDGSKMYISGAIDPAIYQYDLGPLYDVGSRVFTGQYSPVIYNIQCIAFNNSMDRMYYGDNLDGFAYQRDLDTPEDITSSTAAGSTLSTEADGDGSDSIRWNPDGSEVYILDYYYGNINQYSTGTFDIEVNFKTGSQNVSSGAEFTLNNPRGIEFKPDGSRVYVCANGDSQIVQFDLPVSWLVGADEKFAGSFNINAVDASPESILWNDDGSKMYIVDSNNASILEFGI